jgi:hypothetical protein
MWRCCGRRRGKPHSPDRRDRRHPVAAGTRQRWERARHTAHRTPPRTQGGRRRALGRILRRSRRVHPPTPKARATAVRTAAESAINMRLTGPCRAEATSVAMRPVTPVRRHGIQAGPPRRDSYERHRAAEFEKRVAARNSSPTCPPSAPRAFHETAGRRRTIEALWRIRSRRMPGKKRSNGRSEPVTRQR